MHASTLALVQIENADEIFTSLGEASLELFLNEFEERVQNFTRQNDEVLKIQPYKYCVLLQGVTDPLQIELAGAKLARLFEPPIRVLNEEFRALVHTAFVPPAANKVDTKTRLRIAEAGLGEARRTNRSFVIRETVEDDKTIAVKRARQIELAFERGEFVMFYQPQVHAGYRNIIGAESLMRWLHPKHGVRPPSEFIPFVDQSAIMRSLTWFAIKSSVAQASTWPASLTVSVNISPLLLHDPDLIPTVEDTLSIFDLPGSRLTLEITEDAMLEDPKKAIDVLCNLQSLGVKIAIDDFGTGYSSLANFREMPADELKIDRSFVTNMLERQRDHDIVKAIIDLGHTLAMKVVAEGIEDNETADELQKMGVDVLQGYWFSKPVPSDDLTKLLSN